MDKKATRRSANIKGFLGPAPTFGSSGKELGIRKQPITHNQPNHVPSNKRVIIPSLRRKNPAYFSKFADVDCVDERLDNSPPSSGSSITSHSSTNSKSTLCEANATPGNIPRSQSEDQNTCSSDRSLSCDDSTLTSVTGLTSSLNNYETYSLQQHASLAHQSDSILDLMENLDNVDDSYMLSVFWNSGDAMTQKEDLNSSIAGNTKCSFASTSSSMTSTSSYTWTSASRHRHKGAYTKRFVKDAPKASWLDTMEESSTLLFGPLNNWCATRGWKSGGTPKWDPKPQSSTWETLDPVFDNGEYKSEERSDWNSVVD